jgi:hypothetical protein
MKYLTLILPPLTIASDTVHATVTVTVHPNIERTYIPLHREEKSIPNNNTTTRTRHAKYV